jgi:osmoprotectant transport system permease protein
VIAALRAGPTGDPANLLQWFSHRQARAPLGPIPHQLWVTLWHSAIALVIVVAIAAPLGAVLAHLRRGERIASFFVSVGRAVPTVTVVGVVVIISLRNGLGSEPVPIIVALVLLGLPPVFANTYAGVRNVDEAPVSAARAMGATELQVLLQVELPLGLPVVLAGIRTAAVQIVATEPLGAFFGGSGVGFYLSNGIAVDNTPQIQAAALLVAALAAGTELALVLATRLTVPEGIRRAGRPPRHRLRTRSSGTAPALPGTLREGVTV